MSNRIYSIGLSLGVVFILFLEGCWLHQKNTGIPKRIQESTDYSQYEIGSVEIGSPPDNHEAQSNTVTSIEKVKNLAHARSQNTEAKVPALPKPATGGHNVAGNGVYLKDQKDLKPIHRIRESGFNERPHSVSSSSDGKIEFNFDNADLNEVIRTLADILQIRYIAASDLEGKVTIQTAGGMDRKSLFPVFFKILEINGLSATKDGGIYRITKNRDISRLPISVESFFHPEDGLYSDKRAIIKIIPLKNISPGVAAKVLTPFVSKGAAVVSHEESRMLLVVDKRDNIEKILKIVRSFDHNIFSHMYHRFYFLENAGAKETADLLGAFFSTSRKSPHFPKFLSIERLNVILAVSMESEIFEKIDQLILQIDTVDMKAKPKLSVYFVKNGTAEDLSELLNAVFKTKKSIPLKSKDTRLSSSKKTSSFSRNPYSKKPEYHIPEKSKSKKILKNEASSQNPESNIVITSDPVRNALIIEATHHQYLEIKRILDAIDVLPRQVLIEATIAEIRLTDQSQLGISWNYQRNNNAPQTGLISATIDGKSGLAYSIQITEDLLNSLNALAQKNRINILSSPHVLASDNKEAKIDISDEIPIISSETTVTSGTQPIITTDIQYRDTGVILSVTPHINENALVTMDIFQEVSEQSENVTVAGVQYPSFFKRTVNTTLTVKHGQTIVLGGLIREKKSNKRNGVPLLMDIPYLGYLFGGRDQDINKTELIILLTPRVINTLDDVKIVTEEFERKVSGVVDSIKMGD